MKRIFATVFAVLMSLCVCASAENFYVDAQNGNDANSGTTPENAWKTLRNVNTYPFQPGDTIALRAGQVWREQIRCRHSGKPDAPITYTRYGEGPKPELRGSLDMTRPELWERYAPGIWVTPEDKVRTLGSYPEFQEGNWHHYSEGKARTRWNVSKDEEGRTLCTLQTLQPTDRACDIQLTCSAFTLPADRAFRLRCLVRLTQDGRSENLMSEELAKKMASCANLMMAGKPWSRYGTLRQSSVKPGEEWTELELIFQAAVQETKTDGRISFFCGPLLPEGSTLSFIPLPAESVEIRSVGLFHDVGNIIMKKKGSQEEICGWKRWDLGSLKDQGDYFHDLTENRLYFRSEKNPAELYSMMEAACRCNLIDLAGTEHIVVEGLSLAYSGGHGLRGGPNCRHCVVRENDFLWIGGSWLYTRGPIPTRYGNGIEFWDGNEDLLVEGNSFFQIYDTAMTNQGPGAGELKEMVWRRNRCVNCEQCYEIWFTSPEMTVKSLTVAENDFRGSGFGWSHAQRPNKRAAHFLAYGFNAKAEKIEYVGNYLGRTKQHMLWFHHPRVSEFQLDRNQYVQPAGASEIAGTSENVKEIPLFYWGGQPKEGVTFEKFRELTGNDQNSTLNRQ